MECCCLWLVTKPYASSTGYNVRVGEAFTKDRKSSAASNDGFEDMVLTALNRRIGAVTTARCGVRRRTEVRKRHNIPRRSHWSRGSWSGRTCGVEGTARERSVPRWSGRPVGPYAAIALALAARDNAWLTIKTSRTTFDVTRRDETRRGVAQREALNSGLFPPSL
jgi:hypothetical protein